jgi:hypothetical protein
MKAIWMYCLAGLLLPQFASAYYEIALDQLDGEYGWAFHREQMISGIPWGDLGDAVLEIRGSYSKGSIQLIHDNFNEVELWTDLCFEASSQAWPDSGWIDVWGNRTPMIEYGEGKFQAELPLHFSKGYRYAVDPSYSGNIYLWMFQVRTIHGGDIITQEPILNIDRAVLIIPEPASLLVLGLGGLWLRRRHCR